MVARPPSWGGRGARPRRRTHRGSRQFALRLSDAAGRDHPAARGAYGHAQSDCRHQHVADPAQGRLLVADALVVLRNAIEHTLFAEVEYRDGRLDEKAAKVVEMPAAQTYDAFDAWVKGRARNGPPSLQRGSELIKRIEGLQPFQRTLDPHDHPLALLASHTNHSKH